MFKISYTSWAAKTLLRMPRSTADLIRAKIQIVAKDPYAVIPKAKKLQGRPGYRLRVGDWRVIYEINKNKIVIIILNIAQRGEVY